MADNWIMGHTKWLFVLVICSSSRNAFCYLSLNMEESVTGVRGSFVKIPCTYTPSKGYEEVKVEWSLLSEVIVHRMESQDHIPLLKFRERVEISKSPGDVSLTIRKLSFGDKGNMKCKVTWKKNDGTLTSNEEITVLKVLRANSESSVDSIATREPDYKTTKPANEKPKENIIATTHQEPKTTNPESTVDLITTEEPDINIMKPTTENPKENIITSTYEELETPIPVTQKHDETTLSERTTDNSHLDDGFHGSTVSTMENTERTAIKRSHESTTVTALYTGKIFDNNAAIPQKEGFRMPLFILIAIIICVLCVTAVVIVLLIIKHRKRKGSIYELSTMNQLLALEGAGQRCQSTTDETRPSNTYELCNPPPVSEYEGMLATFSNEYESLVVEKQPENKCS